MAVIGIEYRRTYMVVAFGEPQSFPVLIGDGKRTLIPTAVCRDDWGSAAAQWPDAIWMDENSANDLPDHCLGTLWTGMRSRLREYLGISETALSGIPIHLVVSGEDGSRVSGSLRAAAFRQVHVVSPTQAAISSLLLNPLRSVMDGSHLVVTVGDISADIAAFTVKAGNVVHSSRNYCCERVGAAYWTQELAKDLDSLRSAAQEGFPRLLLWQSMLEMAPRLCGAKSEERVPWEGAHANELVSSVSFAPNRLEWDPRRRLLLNWLSQTTPECLFEIGTKSVEAVWLAGSGSIFPIKWAYEENKQSLIPDPLHAIALGATALRCAEPEPLTKPNVLIPLHAPMLPSANPTVSMPSQLDKLLTDVLGEFQEPA